MYPMLPVFCLLCLSPICRPSFLLESLFPSYIAVWLICVTVRFSCLWLLTFVPLNKMETTSEVMCPSPRGFHSECFIPEACNLFCLFSCYISPQWCQAGLWSAITLKNNRIKGQSELFSKQEWAIFHVRRVPLPLRPSLLAKISACWATFDM